MEFMSAEIANGGRLSTNHRCAECGNEFERDEFQFQWDDDCELCEHCFIDKVIELAKFDPVAMAHAMRLEVR